MALAGDARVDDEFDGSFGQVCQPVERDAKEFVAVNPDMTAPWLPLADTAAAKLAGSERLASLSGATFHRRDTISSLCRLLC
jgi:hypothetical protein